MPQPRTHQGGIGRLKALSWSIYFGSLIASLILFYKLVSQSLILNKHPDL